MCTRKLIRRRGRVSSDVMRHNNQVSWLDISSIVSDLVNKVIFHNSPEFCCDHCSSMMELKSCNCIFGQTMTLDELLNLNEEHKIGENAYHFEGGDQEIIA